MNPETTITTLLEAWQDGGLTEAESADLLHQLAADAELRRCFAEQVALLGAVRASAEQNPRWLALFDLLESASEADGANGLSFEEATMDWITPKPPRKWYQQPSLQALAASVILLLTGLYFLKPKGKDATKQTADGSSPAEVSAVAVVIGASAESDQAVGTYLKPGRISQDRGWLTLQTLNGVSVTLDAPFRAELQEHDRIRLDEGRARVRVPEGAEGFRLSSASFDVVDLGTEFAAKVNSDGTGTCRVFEGEADVSLLDSIGEVKRTKRITASESVRVTPSQQDLGLIKESNDDYPEIKQPPRPTLELPSSYASDLMSMNPEGYWRFEEIRNNQVRNEVTDGARLQAAGSASIAVEQGGNHSGALIQSDKVEFFQIPNRVVPMLVGDFSISLFAQFEWLQNFALISATRFDNQIQGDSFTLQSYASYRASGLNGTGLHAVLRDPPAWEGGFEVYGNTLLRPHFWHHIAATRKADQLTLYLDGVKVGTRSTGAMPLNYGEIFVGRLNGNAGQSRNEARGLVGYIDELAVFANVLTDKQIAKLANPAKK